MHAENDAGKGVVQKLRRNAGRMQEERCMQEKMQEKGLQHAEIKERVQEACRKKDACKKGC